MPDANKASDHKLLKSLFANAAIGIVVMDSSRTILCVGQGLCTLLGYESEELVGRKVDILIHPNDRGKAENSMKGLISEGTGGYATERLYVHKNGAPVWIIASVSALPGTGRPGEPAMAAQITPIAKQKQAEWEAAEALDRWTFALDSSGQGIWDYNLETDEWFFSPTWKRMRGIPEDEEVNGDFEDWLDIVHPEDRDSVVEFIDRQNSGATEYVSYEYREKHRDGHWMWILARGRCVEYKADGKPLRVIGTDTDITELKQREMELATMSQRLELALKTSGIGVWETDLKTGEAVWDGKTFEIFGIPPTANPLPPGAWEEVLHPDEKGESLSLFNEAVANREEYSFDYKVLTPKGETRHVRCRADFNVDQSGREKMIGVNWDISDDLRLADALRRANRLAEQRNRDLELARQEMEHASLHDSLTGLPNRRWIDDRLAQFARARKPSLTLLHLDLDRFKQINDTQGHAAGDAMLKHMAQLLRTSVRKEDEVARIGGDEFVILLSPTPKPDELANMVDRIIKQSRAPMFWDGHECRSGVSVGIAEASSAEEALQVLVNADIALYRAKNSGRGCAAYFSQELQAEIIRNKRCADDILDGLDRGQFVPYFQPQIDAQTLRTVGAEVLVRWEHPQLGVLTPDRFLSVADELNVVNIIDRQMLEGALGYLKEWDKKGYKLPRISLNLSARRLTEKDLVHSLRALDVERGRVSFEILESIFLDEGNEAISFAIDAIKELGIDIDVDDFGTGYSSIVSLVQLKPHSLKIDKQLVHPIEKSSKARHLLRSIVEIGKTQGIKVCAEGVETAGQAIILQDLECDVLQGYYFARPMPADEMAEYLDKQMQIGARTAV